MAQLFGRSHDTEIAKGSLDAVVESYLRFYAAGSHHTARAKQIDLGHFLSFLAVHRRKKDQTELLVSDWDHSAVQRFVDDRLAHGESPATVSRRLATLKHMGRTISENIAGFINPAKEIKPPKVQVLRPKSLNFEEIQKILKAADDRISGRNSFVRRRNRMIVLLLIDTGLRADEVRMLKRSQIDETLEWITSVRTKSRRFRNVYITSDIRAELRDYIERRSEHLRRWCGALTKKLDDQSPLFVSTVRADPANPESLLMGNKSVWRAVNELSSGTPLHPHLLRHSFASDLLESSNDIRLVAQALGHSDVRVTMRYTERADRDVALALERARKER